MTLTRSFIKDNFIIVLGIALPLLLVVFFAAARAISTVAVDPPQFKAVYAQSDNYNKQFRYNVDANGQLRIEYEGQKYHGGENATVPVVPARTTLFVLDPVTGTVTKEQITIPNIYFEGVTNAEIKNINVKIDTQGTTAPDGYTYARSERGYNRGIMPELFGYRSGVYDERYMIRKGGRVFYLQTENKYQDIDFIGWTKGTAP